MTYFEKLTEEYLKALESEAQQFSEDNKRDMLDSAAIIIALYLGSPQSQGYAFKFTKSADLILAELKNKLYVNFKLYSENGITLSRMKGEKMFGKLLTQPVIDNWLTRKVGNFTLRQRIAKYTQMFRMELEARVAQAIVNGEKQDFVIRAISKHLNDPYSNLEPKIRKLWASNRMARKYNPGTGKYKSAYANFKRLAYSEIIEVYRRADHEVWKKQADVTGVLVYLNPAHPVYDSCDDLVGIYPKGFIFTGFHPRCICLAMPIIKGKNITTVPNSAKEYMQQENPKKWWGGLPFVTENLKYWK